MGSKLTGLSSYKKGSGTRTHRWREGPKRTGEKTAVYLPGRQPWKGRRENQPGPHPDLRHQPPD